MNKELIKKLQGDLTVQADPLTAEECVALKLMLQEGLVRRFGAILNHREIGYTANCMVAWGVADSAVSKIGEFLAQADQVSHCYERPRFKDFPYNLYTMVHGKSKNDIIAFVEKESKDIAVTDYQLLWSLVELKKTSPKYVV